ncbi:16S rRNA (guanine(527)-N(7))-methyltransferase RsmG [Thalassococcus lentus]|uniref:Ribosomal RNA small subunit methyltransferase G n=1 Tax=Thalassococcus lentus TaxID=1210524 RepID=A0ABT4XN84_9RHOB|nr:16S rRNA (guanine(527)-N(7))-methyltransferase RsmG [Thalassococcus lentus]MDA7423404.1 16S rRNA (guanine(527)-N(7))-methyltransferase RsmG [Thalassococcus lentus]
MSHPVVSRETKEKLRHFLNLLKKWNPKINLVAKSTINEAWDRHIEDSIQVFDCRPDAYGGWVDLGSGGGFPGLVVAILSQEFYPNSSVTMIESDVRKATFLRTVLRETDTAGTVLAERIESATPQNAEVVSARALAPLDHLLGYCAPHIAEGGVALLPKGASWKKELDQALQTWRFDWEITTSKTQADAVVMKIRNITNA